MSWRHLGRSTIASGDPFAVARTPRLDRLDHPTREDRPAEVEVTRRSGEEGPGRGESELAGAAADSFDRIAVVIVRTRIVTVIGLVHVAVRRRVMGDEVDVQGSRIVLVEQQILASRDLCDQQTGQEQDEQQRPKPCARPSLGTHRSISVKSMTRLDARGQGPHSRGCGVSTDAWREILRGIADRQRSLGACTVGARCPSVRGT